MLAEAAGVLSDAMEGAAEVGGALVGLADGIELMIDTVLVAVGVAVDPPQFHQPPEAVTVTVRVSSTTLVTMYLLSKRGVANPIEARSMIARVRVFILNVDARKLRFSGLAIKEIGFGQTRCTVGCNGRFVCEVECESIAEEWKTFSARRSEERNKVAKERLFGSKPGHVELEGVVKYLSALIKYRVLLE